MPTFTADLSVASLDKLLSDVKSYRDKVNAAPEKITARLAEIGADAIRKNIAGITDPDGNAPGTVSADISGSHATVSQSGDQIAFLEYGTGEQGEASKHPEYQTAGWRYGSGKNIRKMKNGKMMWHYYDRLRGHWRITDGLPAQKQVFRAALTMRDNIVPVAKEALK
ncbi:hypothetical protein [Caproiciproducens sp.]|uniref:hypothetical protein n=1 Tax=Caproiciproducens sp. TaxID=1954376 RepID=UPI0028A094FF|nr:hypothetical protein [Caproiciproducens sp.]